MHMRVAVLGDLPQMALGWVEVCVMEDLSKHRVDVSSES